MILYSFAFQYSFGETFAAGGAYILEYVLTLESAYTSHTSKQPYTSLYTAVKNRTVILRDYDIIYL